MIHPAILQTALAQSAADLCCAPEDFLKNEPVFVRSEASEKARKYLKLPFSCQFATYGSNIVASVSPEFEAVARAYLARCAPAHCFETPNLHLLNEALAPLGAKICFMAEYFLPVSPEIRPLPCPYELRVLTPDAFAPLYTELWSNALSPNRPHLDRLAVGAYDGETLIGLAGCSADCDTMWQIGIDVLAPYRRQGVASALTSRLACEIFARGKVPFYCAAWSNLPSVRNALKSGFVPAWAEMTAKPIAMVDEMNGGRPLLP